MNDVDTQPLWHAMNNQRYDADRLLLEFGIASIPINVFEIARKLEVHVHLVRNAHWNGAVDSSSGKAHIWVDADQTHTQQRFTAAHEIGHLLLHEPGRVFRDTWSSSKVDIAEIQANNFATNFLMPSWLVIPNVIPGSSRIADLAKTFAVSPQAMKHRLENLGFNIDEQR